MAGGKKHNVIRAAKNRDRKIYVRQGVRTEKNKRKRREKYLEKHPNDIQAKEIIKKLFRVET